MNMNLRTKTNNPNRQGLQKQRIMNMYDKALKALERAGFNPGMVGAPDDPCIYINVWNDDLGAAYEMRLHDTEIMWWAGKHDNLKHNELVN